jgi:hypothetical protein
MTTVILSSEQGQLDDMDFNTAEDDHVVDITNCNNQTSVDDGFIQLVTNKKKKMSRKNQSKEQANKRNAISKSSSSTFTHNAYKSSTSVQFGASKWAKPTIQRSERLLSQPHDTPQNLFSKEQSVSTISNNVVTHTTSRNDDEATLPSTLSPNKDNVNFQTASTDETMTIRTSDGGTSEDDIPSFQLQSLSALMEDYGEYDANWMKVEPSGLAATPVFEEYDDCRIISHDTNEQQQIENTDKIVVNSLNRLQLHGHAPIHVEFVSFGFRHGVPSEVRFYSTGNCYRQPLLPFDIRGVIAPIAPYLIHMDGKSPVIKNTMIRWKSPIDNKSKQHGSRGCNANKQNPPTKDVTYMNVKDYVHENIIPPVVDAIIEAIDVGKHGYASPLTVSIYVGSEIGRHRSVVTSEIAATVLRKLLRTNDNNCFQCPVSVGCRHRDLQQQHNSNGHKASSKIQKAFEDE